MAALDNIWPSVVVNLRNAWKQWMRMSRILVQKGEYPRTSGKIFKAVVQATILFVAESWVMSPRIERTLGDFLHRFFH